MSCYSYCPHCDIGMDEPTVEGVADGQVKCWQCGRYSPSHKSTTDLLLQLFYKVEELEREIELLKHEVRNA